MKPSGHGQTGKRSCKSKSCCSKSKAKVLNVVLLMHGERVSIIITKAETKQKKRNKVTCVF
jgi:hypothetical protein